MVERTVPEHISLLKKLAMYRPRRRRRAREIAA
ncbi:hypothetical protein ACVI1J_004099 [Bradyrhizobium diazoefficiens]